MESITNVNGAASIISSDNPLQIISPDSELYEAATESNIEPFKERAQHLERILTESKDTILHINVKSESGVNPYEFMKEILEMCPLLLLQANDKGDTPLHAAVETGNPEVVRVLLQLAKAKHQDIESGLRVDWHMLRMTNSENDTALHKAARRGHGEMVWILTEDGDPNFSYSANKSGEIPLYLAAATGEIGMMYAILRSCKSGAHEFPNGMTALHAAVMLFKDKGYPSHGLKSLFEAIIEKKKNLTKETDQYGWTPLHYAAYYGFKDATQLLLRFDKSAASIPDNNRKMTALHMAASQGHRDIIEEFFSHGLEEYIYEKGDSRGWNVLHFAMLSLSKRENLNLLKNPSIKSLVDKKDNDGNTPLHIRAAAYRDSFSRIGDRRALNKQKISVEHMLEYGSPELEEDIQVLFEDFGNGHYSNGVIRNRKDDEYYFKIQDERRKKYYEGLKETRSSHLLVATLIATVTFTAAFTIPGGYNSERGAGQGTAILITNLAFRTFIMTDTIALTLSLSAVFVHFIMSFQKFQKYQNLFTLALRLTILAMGALVVAFVAGIYSVLAPSFWLAVATCSIGLSFFLLVLYALKLMYWSDFLEWGNSAWEVFCKCHGWPSRFMKNN